MIDVMKEVNEDITKFTLRGNSNGTMTILKDGCDYVCLRNHLIHGYISNKARPISEDEMLYLIHTL